MTEYINGPINFAHLQGSIDSIDKNIYFFMDTHNDLDNQTRCESFNSIDISQYLYQKIIETKKPLDFFMEIRSTDIDTIITNKRDIYIKEVISLFKTEYMQEKKENNTIIRYSKSNPIVKLHYLDIRDHLELFDVFNIIKYDIKQDVDLFINNLKNNKKKQDIDSSLNNGEKKDIYTENIFNNINLIKKKIEEIINNKNEVIENILNNYNKNTEAKKYYLNKIINKYENLNLKKKIKKFINNYCNVITYNLNIVLDDFEENIEKFNNIDNKILYDFIDTIITVITDLYSLFTDIYLLRRILDKKYVKKAIVYSGRQHSLNCIFFLIKYYDFKIIKIHDSTEKNIDKLTEQIYNAANVFDTYKLFNVKEKNIQCINYEIIYDGGNRIFYD